MDVIVLAAGYATRMYPLTRDFPKPLLPVQGKPLLTWLMLDLMRIPGLERITVVTNRRFFGAFSDWAQELLRGRASAQELLVLDDGSESNETRLGAVRDLCFARERTGADGDALVLAGDNLLEFSLAGFVSFFREKRASCLMCCEEHDAARLRRSGVAGLDEADRVVSFEEKPGEPRGTFIAPPFYCYRAAELALLSEALASGASVDAPGSFAAYLVGRAELYAYRMPGRRIDVGSIEGYHDAQRCFRPLPELAVPD